MTTLPLLLMLGLSAPVAGTLPPGAPPGRVTERLACAADPTQSYALYLPPGYAAGRRWPVVILMDPRGRAMVPLRLFSTAAGRRGYLLVSSYGTASDGPADVNAQAMAALLPETERRYAIDPKRLYLAGFSGTARAAWEFATRLKGHVAGIIGFGGGLPPGFTPAPDPGFAFFGGAGTTDFNYEEMLALDARLQELGMPHRFRSYTGPHSWGPEDACAEAIDWMEIEAMRSGLRERDDTVVGEFFAASMERARAAEAAGRRFEAAVRLREVAADMEGLRDPGDAIARATALEKTREARRARSEMARHASRQKSYEARLSAFVATFQARTPPPALSLALSSLEIPSLKKRAGKAADDEDALAARRLLALVAVYTGYYLPEEYMQRKDPGRALAVLRIADAIDPGSPGAALGMARARAQMGEKTQALDDLRRAVASGRFDAAVLEADPWLDPLRKEPGYQELLETLGTRDD